MKLEGTCMLCCVTYPGNLHCVGFFWRFRVFFHVRVMQAVWGDEEQFGLTQVLDRQVINVRRMVLCVVAVIRCYRCV